MFSAAKNVCEAGKSKIFSNVEKEFVVGYDYLVGSINEKRSVFLHKLTILKKLYKFSKVLVSKTR